MDGATIALGAILLIIIIIFIILLATGNIHFGSNTSTACIAPLQCLTPPPANSTPCVSPNICTSSDKVCVSPNVCTTPDNSGGCDSTKAAAYLQGGNSITMSSKYEPVTIKAQTITQVSDGPDLTGTLQFGTITAGVAQQTIYYQTGPNGLGITISSPNQPSVNITYNYGTGPPIVNY